MGRDEAGVRLLVVGGCRVYLAHRPIIETSGESQRPTETNRSPLPVLQDKRFPSTAALPHSYSPPFFYQPFISSSACLSSSSHLPVLTTSPCPALSRASAAPHTGKKLILKRCLCVYVCLEGGLAGVERVHADLTRESSPRVQQACPCCNTNNNSEPQTDDAKSTNANPRLFSASLVFCCGFTCSWSS